MSPRFIRAMHPKREVQPKPETLQRLLGLGWVGQTKIHGHRCQLHISSKTEEPIVAYTRIGKHHTRPLTPAMEKEVRRLFTPKRGWNVIDAEWYKPEDKLYVFDFLKKEDKILKLLTFPERFKLLPREYISPRVMTLPLLKDEVSCLKVLSSPRKDVEGLVFKSMARKGFADTSIIRCRKRN